MSLWEVTHSLDSFGDAIIHHQNPTLYWNQRKTWEIQSTDFKLRALSFPCICASVPVELKKPTVSESHPDSKIEKNRAAEMLKTAAQTKILILWANITNIWVKQWLFNLFHTNPHIWVPKVHLKKTCSHSFIHSVLFDFNYFDKSEFTKVFLLSKAILFGIWYHFQITPIKLARSQNFVKHFFSWSA